MVDGSTGGIFWRWVLCGAMVQVSGFPAGPPHSLLMLKLQLEYILGTYQPASQFHRTSTPYIIV
ncbi:hypothetical protein NQZ68_002975 [Dissostichus eleginoides]|nr:hypothetical protein NQZ68_002975 [Dissostichus eleginoides]